ARRRATSRAPCAAAAARKRASADREGRCVHGQRGTRASERHERASDGGPDDSNLYESRISAFAREEQPELALGESAPGTPHAHHRFLAPCGAAGQASSSRTSAAI